MMKIIAFDGSPRRNGNSTIILHSFLKGAAEKGADISVFKTDNLDLRPCRGCLMCNTLKKCAVKKDQWPELYDLITAADVLAFSTPIYFHHASSSMKRLLDRFRCFVHVQITETGLVHTPFLEWKKKLFIFTAQGSPAPVEAVPLNELFTFITEIMGTENELKIINGLRLAVSNQISYEKKELETLYNKLEIPVRLADEDFVKNFKIIADAYKMGGECLTLKNP